MKRIIKNLKGRAPPSSHMLAPPIRSHQPKTGVGLRIEIDNQDFFFMQLCEGRPNIDNGSGLSDATFEIDECKDLGTHRVQHPITRESDVRIKFFSL